VWRTTSIGPRKFLRRRGLIENPSSYLLYRIDDSRMGVSALAQRTGCCLLCDVNNHLGRVQPRLVGVRLPGRAAAAGGRRDSSGRATRSGARGRGEIRIDDHGSKVCPRVWALYSYTVASWSRADADRMGHRPAP